MGTGGLRVFRVRRVYYCIHIPCDAYPSGAGRKLLREIPQDPDELKGE